RESELANAKYTSLVMKESAEPRTTYVHVRGNFLDKGKEVTPGVPAILPPLPADQPTNRLALARWLVSSENPLTARVTVNRLWERVFGTGIVKTSEDFGKQGELPSHPELLDWLACEFMNPCSSRREEAQISRTEAKGRKLESNQSLLTSAPTDSAHALRITVHGSPSTLDPRTFAL